MRALFKNISNSRSVSIIDKLTGRVFELKPGESCDFVVKSEEDIKDYRRSYGIFGITVEVKPYQEPAEAPVEEEAAKEEAPAEEPAPKKRKSSKAKVEEAPAEEPKQEETPAENVAEENKLEEVETENVEVEVEKL